MIKYGIQCVDIIDTDLEVSANVGKFTEKLMWIHFELRLTKMDNVILSERYYLAPQLIYDTKLTSPTGAFQRANAQIEADTRGCYIKKGVPKKFFKAFLNQVLYDFAEVF